VAREATHISLRIPVGLKEELDVERAKTGNDFSAEVIERLKKSLEETKGLAALESRVRAIEQTVMKLTAKVL
jgi:hypothetical protein